MKNKVTDLNNHLFVMMERLLDDELTETPEQIEKEVKRAEALTKVAQTAIANAKLTFEAYKYQDEFATGNAVVPDVLRVGSSLDQIQHKGDKK